MKKLTNLLAALVFASLFIFTSCGGTDKPGKEPEPNKTANEIAAENLSGSWKAAKADIKRNAGAPDEGWGDVTVVFSGSKDGGSYTVTGVPEGYTKVWAASGKWAFEGDTGKSLKRAEDNIIMSTTFSDDKKTLTVKFDVPEEQAARTNGISGSWEFKFTKQ